MQIDNDADPDGQHFLGAVAYESRKPVIGDVTWHDVIDGQQRMTTMQILLDSVHEVVRAAEIKTSLNPSVDELGVTWLDYVPLKGSRAPCPGSSSCGSGHVQSMSVQWN
ncbi:UNVERIFIED_ORG: hypothetical protein ABIB19_000247 [Arthrobacter sp. UYEF10]